MPDLAQDMHFLVQQLSSPPFNIKNLTLVELHAKTPLDLAQILTQVFAQLSPEYDNIDVRDETPEQTAERIADTLFRILNYQQNLPNHRFKEQLLKGDRNVVYPALVWLLRQLPILQTRAYLARFLVSVEVPEHLLNGDDEVADVYAQYKQVQEDFKESHKEAEKHRSSLVPPAEIKRAIHAMEEDKDQLERKIGAMHTKLEGSAGFAEMLREVQLLRVEQEDALRLQEREREQRLAYSAVESHLTGLKAELAARKGAEARERDPRRLLSKLEAEVEALGSKAASELPRAIAARRARFDEMQDLLAMPVGTEQGLRDLAAQRAQLQRDVAELEARKKASLADPDDKLAMFRQQAGLVARKRDTLQARLQSFSHERAAVEAELAGKAQQLEAIKDKPVLKGDDLKKYAAELRGKTAQYKGMKAELAGLRAERGILQRTEAIVRALDQTVSDKLRALEGTRGVSGLMANEEALQRVQEEKAEVDAAKGQTLEEISKVVEQTLAEIKASKNRLAPQIAELRALRVSFQDIESTYNEKKAAYDSVKAGVNSGVAKAQADLDAEEKDEQHEESACYRYETLIAIEAARMARVEAEKVGRALERKLADGTVVRTYRELYEHKLGEQERAQKELRDQQRALKENHGPNKVQMRMFRDLNQLLRCKVELQKRARAEASSMLAQEQSASNVLSLGD